ncbi:MAG: DUF975 family protein [Clostridiales bacterium]|nr:DUF975 family protein [Clostridiales bacterium]
MDNLNRYKSNEELKAAAKDRLFGKYGVAIGASIVIGSINLFVSNFSTVFINMNTIYGIALDFVISFVISVLSGILTSGLIYLFLKISCKQPVSVGDIFYGFKMFPDKAVLIQLYMSAWTYAAMIPYLIFLYLVIIYPENAVISLFYYLSLLLYYVVYVMILLIYSQSFYLLHDFPEYSVSKILSTSRKLMKGNKFRLFYFMVSFFPLLLLGLLSCGIAYFWIVPYVYAANTEFFLDLVKKNQVPD